MVYYPSLIDTDATLPPFVDGQPVSASISEKLRTTIIAIESELGIKPSGVSTTVRARLDALDAHLLSFQPIVLTKDLGGTFSSPKVVGIQGRPISTAAPSVGQVLVWNGIAWIPSSVSGGGTSFMSGDVIGTTGNNLIAKLAGNNLYTEQVLDVNEDGYFLVWNGIDGYWAASKIDLNQSVGGDLGGFLPNPIVTGIQQVPVQQFNYTSNEDGYILVYNHTSNQWEPKENISNLNGDITGAITNSFISKIQGNSISAASPNINDILSWDGYNWIPSDHIISGDVNGTLTSSIVTKIQNRSISNNTPTDGYVLTWDSINNIWEPKITSSGFLPGGVASGNLSGFYPSPTVIAINNVSVNSNPSLNTVLIANSNTSSTWDKITDATIQSFSLTDNSIASNAAILGTKISPNFGSQNIQTTGTISTTSNLGITTSIVNISNNTNIPTITSGQGAPSATSINGSIFLRTDGTQTSALYSYQSGVWAPVGITAIGTAGGDLSGSYPNPTVSSIQNNSVYNQLLTSTQDGYVLTWSNSDGYLAVKPTSISTITAGGDLSGIYPNPTVSKINGVTVTGVASTGSVLTATSSSTANWSSAGIITLAGDVTGDTGNSTVIALRGRSLNVFTPEDGYVLTWEQGSTSWIAKPTSISTITAGGDLSGSYPNPTVSKIQSRDISNVAPQDGYVLTWSNSDGYWFGQNVGDGYQHLQVFSGIISNIGTSSNTFIRLGSIMIDSSSYKVSPTVIFNGIFEATVGRTAELRLYNVTDGVVVSNSTLSTSSNVSDYKFALISLSPGIKIYEAQLRITSGSPLSFDGAVCTSAKIIIK